METYAGNTLFFSNGGTSETYSGNFTSTSSPLTTINGFCGGGGTYNGVLLSQNSFPYSQNGADPGTCGFAYINLITT